MGWEDEMSVILGTMDASFCMQDEHLLVFN
jgi:hypothetical protein